MRLRMSKTVIQGMMTKSGHFQMTRRSTQTTLILWTMKMMTDRLNVEAFLKILNCSLCSFFYSLLK